MHTNESSTSVNKKEEEFASREREREFNCKQFNELSVFSCFCFCRLTSVESFLAAAFKVCSQEISRLVKVCSSSRGYTVSR